MSPHDRGLAVFGHRDDGIVAIRGQ